MKKLSLVVAVMVAVAVMAAPVFAANVTVGQFLSEVAKAKNLAAADGATAAASLKAVGVNLPALDLNRPLTEGDVAAIASAVGLKVTTSNPSAQFSQSQVETFLSSFATDLGRNPAPPEATPRGEKPPPGGWKKGHNKSQTEPI